MAPMLAVLATDPAQVLAAFSGLFMERVASFSRAITVSAIRFLGPERAIPVIVAITALLTYGGVSVFVAVFAVHPFAAELFAAPTFPSG